MTSPGILKQQLMSAKRRLEESHRIAQEQFAAIEADVSTAEVVISKAILSEVNVLRGELLDQLKPLHEVLHLLLDAAKDDDD